MDIKPIKDRIQVEVDTTEGQEREMWRRFLALVVDEEGRQFDEEGEAMSGFSTGFVDRMKDKFRGKADGK